MRDAKPLTLKRAVAAAPRPQSTVPKPFTVARDGFSLNADVTRPDVIQRILEHVARHAGPPAFSVPMDSQTFH